MLRKVWQQKIQLRFVDSACTERWERDNTEQYAQILCNSCTEFGMDLEASKLGCCRDGMVCMMAEGMTDEGVVRRCGLLVGKTGYVGEERQHMRYSEPGM